MEHGRIDEPEDDIRDGTLLGKAYMRRYLEDVPDFLDEVDASCLDPDRLMADRILWEMFAIREEMKKAAGRGRDNV